MNIRSSLRTRILAPLALVLLLLLAAFVYNLYRQEKQLAAENFAGELQLLQRLYHNSLQEESQELAATLMAITRDDRLREALAAQDRAALLGRALPLFEELRTTQGVTHFYFQNPQRVNILRVHQPDRHGDIINRLTTLAAAQTGKLAGGRARATGDPYPASGFPVACQREVHRLPRARQGNRVRPARHPEHLGRGIRRPARQKEPHAQRLGGRHAPARAGRLLPTRRCRSFPLR